MKKDAFNFSLPKKEYYFLDQAASLLGCAPEDLIHWAIFGHIQVALIIDDGEDKVKHITKEFSNQIERNLGDLTLNGSSIFMHGEDGATHIFGVWGVDFRELRPVEKDRPGEKLHKFVLLEPIGGDYNQMISLENPINAKRGDLVLPAYHFNRLINSNNNTEPRNSNKKLATITPHPTAERFAKNREEVLRFAIYCKSNWPEQCGSTYREWASLIDQKAALFWPESSIPPLSIDQIERLLSKAHKLPDDVD